MRPPIPALALLALATTLLVPAAALAEPLDLGEDADGAVLDTPALETDDAAPSDGARLGDLEDRVDGKGPLALEPTLDLTDEQADVVGGRSPLDHTDPQPAPGFVLKVPTN
jgi:hypothetical protein